MPEEGDKLPNMEAVDFHIRPKRNLTMFTDKDTDTEGRSLSTRHKFLNCRDLNKSASGVGFMGNIHQKLRIHPL
jgi:hypothetical protein